MRALVLTVLFAISISVIALAASFAGAPRSLPGGQAGIAELR